MQMELIVLGDYITNKMHCHIHHVRNKLDLMCSYEKEFPVSMWLS